MSEPPNIEALLATVREALERAYDGRWGHISDHARQELEECSRALNAIASELERVRAERDYIKQANEGHLRLLDHRQARLDRAVALCRELYDVFYPHLDESERVRLRAVLAEIEEAPPAEWPDGDEVGHETC